MIWVMAVVVVVVLGFAAMAATGRLGEMPQTVTDMPEPYFPDGWLVGEDLRSARFAVVARGYSMRQVDELIERLANQLDGKVEPVLWAPSPSVQPSPSAE